MSDRKNTSSSTALQSVPVDALLIIDMQNGFLKNQEELVKKVRDLVKSFPTEQILWLKYRNSPNSPFVKRLYWSEVMVPPQTDIESSLQPFAKNVFIHESYLPEEDFRKKLKGCQYVALAGMDTDACIYAMCFFLWRDEISPVILQNHCGSSGSPQFHKQALDFIRRQFGVDAIVDSIVPSKLAQTLANKKREGMGGPAF